MKNIRLLIADDDAHFLRYLGDLLSDDFCIVGTVSDRTALIAAAVAFDPHIIITDIDMPTMTRLDAIRQLEALLPDIKIMVLTGHEEPECAAAAIAAGASAFLTKKKTPNLCGTIRAIIRDLLTGHPTHPNQFTGKALTYGNDHHLIEHKVANGPSLGGAGRMNSTNSHYL